MTDINELADTLKSFWKFMLLFILILLSLVLAVNAFGWAGEKTEEQLLYTAYDEFPSFDERLLKITLRSPVADDDGIVKPEMVAIDTEALESYEHEMPFFIFEGDGFIEVSHSNTAYSFVIGEPSKTGFKKRYPASNGARLENRMASQLMLRISQLLDAGGEVKDWHFTDVYGAMREYNKLYNGFLGETVPNVPKKYRRVRRYVYESSLFVSLYSEYAPNTLMASAVIKITVYDNWRDGVDARVLENIGLADSKETKSRTEVALVDYWQAAPTN